MHFLSVASLVVIFAGVASTTPVPASGKCVARTTLTSMVPSTAYGPVVTVASSRYTRQPPSCQRTPTSTALTLQQCHALENDARRNNYGQLPIGW
ncbi:hypothetical protein BSLG_001686 [Batrachochytrium salamandrivorans]|nr:hypothetical protein BSLG_001686 [Batrachochytrium salamandrivorans]